MSDTHYAPPKAVVADIDPSASSADIEALQVSEGWKHKFRLIEKAGGVKQPRFKDLTFGERMKIGFNVLGFLFGPIYYAVKGMWRKALTFAAVCFVAIVLLSLLLDYLGLGQLANALSYGAAAVFATRANIDYYKKMVLRDNGWW